KEPDPASLRHHKKLVDPLIRRARRAARRGDERAQVGTRDWFFGEATTDPPPAHEGEQSGGSAAPGRHVAPGASSACTSSPASGPGSRRTNSPYASGSHIISNFSRSMPAARARYESRVASLPRSAR